MVKLEWGTKRTCLGCGTRFYDLLKTPPTCPKCGTIFEVQTTVRSRRGKAAVLDTQKELLGLEGIDIDLELDDEIDVGIDTDLIEDTDDLDEGLNDLPDVMGGVAHDDM